MEINELKDYLIPPFNKCATSIFDGNKKMLCTINELFVTSEDCKNYVKKLMEIVAFVRMAIQEKWEREFIEYKWIDEEEKFGTTWYKCEKCKTPTCINAMGLYCSSCGTRLSAPPISEENSVA
jgi:hypothetical protein